LNLDELENLDNETTSDLKFYYVDTGNWFLEKGRQMLDGAGAGA
jgi:hypothetical protein